jgi:hypothetical protein
VLHALTLAGLALVAGAASAAAVGLTISEVDWANDISGTPVAGHTSAALTEQLLLSLRNATLAQVLADMGDKEGHGRRSTLRFHSDGDALGFPELSKISDTLNGLQAMMAGRSRARRAFPDGFEHRRRQPTGNIKMRGHP